MALFTSQKRSHSSHGYNKCQVPGCHKFFCAYDPESQNYCSGPWDTLNGRASTKASEGNFSACCCCLEAVGSEVQHQRKRSWQKNSTLKALMNNQYLRPFFKIIAPPVVRISCMDDHNSYTRQEYSGNY